MKLKPLSVANIAALAACLRQFEAAKAANNDATLMAIAFGELARTLDHINLPQKRNRSFADMTLPEFLRAVVKLVPDIIEANSAQFTEFPAAAAEFGQALTDLDKSIGS